MADIAEVKQIETESGLSPWSIQDYSSELLRSDSLLYVFKENNQTLGFILARLIIKFHKHSQFLDGIENENEIEIYNIAVRKDSRQRKIGSKLLAQVLNDAAQENVKKLHLEVRKTNSKAQDFYLKNGFKIVGERKNFYTNPTEDAILMSLSGNF